MARKRRTTAAPPPTEVAPPSRRRLQVYALDPAADQSLSTANIARCVLPVRWEPLTPTPDRPDHGPGPVGEYVEVVDVDPSSGCAYDPVDLDHPHLTAQDGLRPSEGNPHFHQQMVYAVVMKTVENFEAALGRPVRWAERPWQTPDRRWLTIEERYVGRLRVYPHALREANAYYSPDKKALLFGYYNAPATDPREELPGGMVFTCLSHDIVAHETTHAILDGIHPALLKPSNGDMLAFHEGFADVVAIFQHFTLPGLLLDQIHKTRGDLGLNNLLAQLAGQFGHSTKRGGALRNALGEFDADGRRVRPQPKTLAGTTKPHDRGAILVAAVFDAFLRMYEDRIRDLRRIASGGTGILRPGSLHPDLASRFADEAVEAAQRVLNIAVRALDYLPPVDVTFGDYLRALITADAELVPDDPRRHRVAFIEAFRERGILPYDVRSLGEDSLRWRPLPAGDSQKLAPFMPPPLVTRSLLASLDGDKNQLRKVLEKVDFDQFKQMLEDVEGADFERFFAKTRVELLESLKYVGEGDGRRARVKDWRRETYRRKAAIAAFLTTWLDLQTTTATPAEAALIADQLGLDVAANREYLKRRKGGEKLRPGDYPIVVHDVRPTYRVRADGRTKVELIVVLTQRQRCELPPDGADAPDGAPAAPVWFTFRGGCTLIIDPESGELRYAIAKRIGSANRRRANERFYRERLAAGGPAVMARYGLEHEYSPSTGKRGEARPTEPFALLHRGDDSEDD